MSEMTVSEARAALPEVLDRVNAGEEVTITRHGVPAAVVVRPDALRVRRRRPGGARAVLMDAFDADVLVYAAVPGHPLGQRVADLFPDDEPVQVVGVGSVLLLPEVLAHPMREGDDDELATLASFLGRLDLKPVDERTAQVATSLAASHRLRAAEAVHLATAVVAGADRFITTNRRDFAEAISEIDVCYPGSLPQPSSRHEETPE